MKLSISTGLYYRKEYIEVLDIIQEAGGTSVELFLNQTFIDVPEEELSRELKARGLTVESIHTPLEFIAFPRRQSEAFWMERSMELARVFGANLIVTHMVDGEYFDELDVSLDDLHRQNLLKYGSEKEIIITTENLPHYAHTELLGNFELLRDFIMNNNIALTFDTTHCAASGLDLIESFQMVESNVRNIHISDFLDEQEHKVIGNGNLPLKEFIEYLKEIHYQGLVTVEYDFENILRNNIPDKEIAIQALKESIELIEFIFKN